MLDGHPDYRLRIDSLSDTEGTALDASNHAACPGHAAYLSEDWTETGVSEPIAAEGAEEFDEDAADAGWQLTWTAVYACTSPAEFGHQGRYGSGRSSSAASTGGETDPAAQEVTKEAARQARRTTLANNKAWRGAEFIRRDWLRMLAARKTAPKGAAALITNALTTDSYSVRKAMETSEPSPPGVDGAGQAVQLRDIGVGAEGEPSVQSLLGVGSAACLIDQPQVLGGDPGGADLGVAVAEFQAGEEPGPGVR